MALGEMALGETALGEMVIHALCHSVLRDQVLTQIRPTAKYSLESVFDSICHSLHCFNFRAQEILH
jgi:hypothetical protein